MKQFNGKLILFHHWKSKNCTTDHSTSRKFDMTGGSIGYCSNNVTKNIRLIRCFQTALEPVS